MKRVLGPSVRDVDERQLEDFIASDDVVFVARLQGDSEGLDARFRGFAHEYFDRYSFGIAAGSSDGSSGISCYNNLDESQHTATDLDNASSLKNLLHLCTAELIPQLTRRNEMTHLSVCSPLCSVPTYLLTSSSQGGPWSTTSPTVKRTARRTLKR